MKHPHKEKKIPFDKETNAENNSEPEEKLYATTSNSTADVATTSSEVSLPSQQVNNHKTLGLETV